MMKRMLLLLLLATVVRPLPAQRRAGLAYYDLGGVYDTVPALFYDDSEWTPAGRFRWTASRYEAAIGRIASVVDSLAMPLVGLHGVETERVALDLAARSCGDYCVVHRTLNTFDGLDFALFYQADRFVPGRVETGQGWMSVAGEMDDLPVVVLLCRQARSLADRVGELRERYPHARLIVMGDSGGFRGERYGLTDVLRGAERAGRGNRRRQNGWRMEDRIWADTAFRPVRADVYARDRLLDWETGRPVPLCNRERYVGGYAAKLPVFVYLFP